MVILQFNKLIRNKWIWGAFAVVVCLAFCFDDFFRGSRDEEENTETKAWGSLGGEPVDGKLYAQCREDIEFWLRYDRREAETDVNLQAWKLYAAQKAAEKNAIHVSDAGIADYAEQVLRNLGAQGPLTADEYTRLIVQRLGMPVSRFEAFCRRGLVAQIVGLEGYPPVGRRHDDESEMQYNYQYKYRRAFGFDTSRSVADATVWASPMEAMQYVYDETDTFTVRVAAFEQDKAERDAVKMSDDLLREWYAENDKSLALPDLYRIRYIAVDATKDADIAQRPVSEKEIQDYYDQNSYKYVKTDTYGTNVTDLASVTNVPNAVVSKNSNGETVVKVTKPIEEVQDEIKKLLGQRKNVVYLRETLTGAAYAPLEGKAVTERLADIAAKYGNPKIATSGWFAKDDKFVEGFMVRASGIIPGAENLVPALKRLSLTSGDPLDRFALVSSEKAVYVLELVETKPAHVPTVEECRGKVDARVLESARAKAFKAKVDAVVAKGTEAILATKGVSTNMTFTVAAPNGVAQDVVRAAVALGKGQVSDMIPDGEGKATVVVCMDRKPGLVQPSQPAQTGRGLEQGVLRYRQMSGTGWGDAYLARVGFVPGEQNAVTKTDR